MGIVGIPQRNTTPIAPTFGCGCQTRRQVSARTATAGSARDGPGLPDWYRPNPIGPRKHARSGAAVLKQKIAPFIITGW